MVHVPVADLRPGASAPPRGALRRDAILQAAQRQFGRYGFRGVTLREVAREAGVSLTLVDHHFGSKLMLFEAVALRWHAAVDTASAPLRALVDAPDPPSLERLVDTFFEVLQAIGAQPGVTDLWNLYMRSRHDEDPAVSRVARDIHAPIQQAFVAVLMARDRALPRAQCVWAYQFVRGALLERAAGDAPGALPEDLPAVPREELRAWLGAFLVAGLRAVLEADRR